MAPRIASKPAMTGVLLVDKPKGMTSHDVVGAVRRIFGQREVGHTGTLDPLATGLMVLALGRATRIARFIEAADKRYDGTVVLGRATATFDGEGEVTEERSIEGIDAEKIRAALRGLEGTIVQRVPAYSAVKVDGERLYARARRGETVEPPEREVTIFSLAMKSFDTPELAIETHVSKGTYIRTLAVQIGAALGVPAHLGALRRTSVGAHRIESARTLDRLQGTADELVRMEDALAHLASIRLDGRLAGDVGHGRPLSAGSLHRIETPSFLAGDAVLLLSPEGELCAVGIATLDQARLASADPADRALGYACVLSTPASGMR